MSKVLDDVSENNNELNEFKNPKNLCVHDLKKKLRVKQKRQFIINTIILSVIVVFFGVISLLIYQSLYIFFNNMMGFVH